METQEILKYVKNSKWNTAIELTGSQMFVVGGAVRDLLLGKSPKDIDLIVTSKTLDELTGILRIFGKVDLVGESFAVIKFKPFDFDMTFDIAVPRKDRKIGDGHKGFEIVTGLHISLEDDLFRRDFTINSIAMDFDGYFIDPFDGQKDLKNKILRATNPNAFADDALRILRAVQFAARFNFKIDETTLSMMKQNIRLLADISGERMIEEFAKIIDKKGNTNVAFKLLSEIGFFSVFGIKHNSGMHVDETINTLGEFMHLLLFFDENKVQTLSQRFKADNDIKKQQIALIKMHEMAEQGIDWRLIAVAMLKTTTDSFRFNQVFSPLVPIFEKMSAGQMIYKITDLEISGDDMMTLGFSGKLLGDALQTLFELVLFDKIPNTKTALLTVAAELKTPRATNVKMSVNDLEFKISTREREFLQNEFAMKQLGQKQKELKKLIKETHKNLQEAKEMYQFVLTNKYRKNASELEQQANEKERLQNLYDNRDISEKHLDYDSFIKLLELRNTAAHDNKVKKIERERDAEYRNRKLKLYDPVTVSRKFNGSSQTLHGAITKIYNDGDFEVTTPDYTFKKIGRYNVCARRVKDLSNVKIPEHLKEVPTRKLLNEYRSHQKWNGYRYDWSTIINGKTATRDEIKAELNFRENIPNKTVTKFKNKK